MIYYISLYLLKFFSRIYFRGTSINRHHIPSKGPCICVINHNSIMDVLAMSLIVKGRVHTMVKEEMFRIPVFKHWLRAVHMFPVIRNSTDRTAFNYAVNLLKKGEILFIAPEGTRKKHKDQVLRARTGFVRLAQLAGCTVIPIAVWGTDRVMPPGQKFPLPVKIAVKVADPIKLEKLELSKEKKHLLQKQADDVMEIVFNMYDELERKYNSKL